MLRRTPTGYGLDDPGSITGRANFSLFHSIQTGCEGSTQLSIQWVLEAASPGVKRKGREADHSNPSSVEIKNSGAGPPLHVCLHGIVLN
jgi:hypothetical protein